MITFPTNPVYLIWAGVKSLLCVAVAAAIFGSADTSFQSTVYSLLAIIYCRISGSENFEVIRNIYKNFSQQMGSVSADDIGKIHTNDVNTGNSMMGIWFSSIVIWIIYMMAVINLLWALI